MTAGGLEKTMVLLQLRPGRLVAQGLAPKQLLDGKSAAGDADADNTDSSSSSSSSGSEVEPEQADNNPVSDDSNSNSSSGSGIEHDNIATQDSIDMEAGASKHPIHAVFVAAGVQLRPRETRPLLRALGVGPHRLVKLGLVQREEARRSRPGGTPSTEVAASMASVYTAAGVRESVVLKCTWAQVTTPTLVASGNTTACTSWRGTGTLPVRTWTMAPFLTGQDGTTTAAPSVYTTDRTARPPARPACVAECGARTLVMTTFTPGRISTGTSSTSSTGSTGSSTEGWRRAVLAVTPVTSAPLPCR
ncbi:unnamed protein product [Ectocarpus sp. CCAP 1310/34]|nr:unnamed protein product [Ectocarpus sp. CCAP 1310/34]